MVTVTLRRRFYAEMTVATLASGLGVLTIFWHDWIEALTGLDPDAGNGSAEWLVVAALSVLAAASTVLARREYRRAGTRPA